MVHIRVCSPSFSGSARVSLATGWCTFPNGGKVRIRRTLGSCVRVRQRGRNARLDAMHFLLIRPPGPCSGSNCAGCGNCELMISPGSYTDVRAAEQTLRRARSATAQAAP